MKSLFTPAQLAGRDIRNEHHGSKISTSGPVHGDFLVGGAEGVSKSE